MKLSHRSNNLKEAKEFLDMNKIKDYEIVVLWNE